MAPSSLRATDPIGLDRGKFLISRLTRKWNSGKAIRYDREHWLHDNEHDLHHLVYYRQDQGVGHITFLWD